MIIKLDEGSLKAAGLPAAFIQTMRHIVRQIGTLTNETTLPEVASQTDGLTPIVNGLVITVTATNAAVSAIETDGTEHAFIDGSIAQRLNEIEAELEQANGQRAAMAKEISLLRDDLGMYEAEQMETGGSIRRKLGVSTLSGSNTGDQTLTSLGAAALAGSSAQDFACKVLTTSANAVINTVKIGTAGTSNFYVDANNAAVRPSSAAASSGIYLQDTTGVTTWALVTVLGVKVSAGFGCNGATPQTAYALGAAATDLASVITLANNLRTLAINNGTGS